MIRILHWFTNHQHAVYGMSLFRILYGLAILLTLVTNFMDRHYLWGAASTWLDPESTRRGYSQIFFWLFPKDNAALFDLSYLLLVAAAVAFTLGWRTRIVTPVLYFLWISLSTNSVYLTNGGDAITRITLIFAIFANLSQHWSLDARRRRNKPPKSSPNVWSIALHNATLALCGYQILLVYVNSAIYKLMGEEWLGGYAVYFPLELNIFRVFPGLSDFASTVTLVVMIATQLTIYVQLLFPLLILWRPSRMVGLILITGMHLSIGLLMGLWPFSLVMIACDLLFVRDATWLRVLPRLARVRAELTERMRRVKLGYDNG